jgi:hypothetical protein
MKTTPTTIAAVLVLAVSAHGEAVKELGQAPSRTLTSQGFRRFRSEPMPFFHSLGAERKPNILLIYTDDQGYGDFGAQNPDSKIRFIRKERAQGRSLPQRGGTCQP